MQLRGAHLSGRARKVPFSLVINDHYADRLVTAFICGANGTETLSFWWVFWGCTYGCRFCIFIACLQINYCTRKLKSIAGNDVSKKPFTSSEETPKVSAFLFDFGKGSVALPSHSLNTQLCQGDTNYPSREPTAKKKKDAWSKSCRIARRQQSDPVILRSHLGNVMIDINVRWWYHSRGCGATILL